MDVYTFLEEEQMISLFTKSGQFVHVAESKFPALLSEWWDGALSHRNYGVDEPVSTVIWRNHKRGLNQKLFQAAPSMREAGYRFGVFCCLCGKVDTSRRSHGVPADFTAFACPSAPIFVDVNDETDEPSGDAYIPAYPFCVDCCRVARRICAKIPDNAAALAAMIFTDGPDFKARVSIYAKNWKTIRFDPRRSPA